MREHGTKTTPVFLLSNGEAPWSLLPSSVSLLYDGTVQSPIPVYLRLQVRSEEAKKERISISNNHSYHQRLSH